MLLIQYNYDNIQYIHTLYYTCNFSKEFEKKV